MYFTARLTFFRWPDGSRPGKRDKNLIDAHVCGRQARDDGVSKWL
jgi:hypothetical protein